MMSTTLKNILILCLAMAMLSGCVPEAKQSKRTSVDDIANSNSGGFGSDQDKTPEAPTFNNSNLAWFVDGKYVEGTVQINESINTEIMIRGEGLHNFLNTNNNSSKTYCMVASFYDSNTAVKKVFRARAVPLHINNLSTRKTEKLLRVDLPQKTDNQSICSGTVARISTSGLQTETVTDGDSSFLPADTCTTCHGLIGSSNISIYTVSGSGLTVADRISSNVLSFSSLGLQINFNNDTSDPVGSCSDSECKAKGFNCCLGSQCVNHAEEKPNVSTLPNYAEAVQRKAENINNIQFFRDIFYVCPDMINPVDDDSNKPDPEDEAKKKLAAKLADHDCLTGGDKDTPDYSKCEPTKDITAFKATRSRVWAICGCRQTPFPTEPENSKCLDYRYEPVTNDQNVITSVKCVAKEDDGDLSPTPIQNLSLNLSTRTAPHRFFDSSGTEHTDMKKANTTTPKPVVEGTEFSYLDNTQKTEPENVDLNMNAILGQFYVDLSAAHPAKALTVEFDQTYIIKANRGVYTPCPQCAPDFWYSEFSSHPAMGVSSTNFDAGGYGLVAIGYSTRRDQIDNNSTKGNYEDTIFGRACWLPPTMIPFSHFPNTDLQTQRLNRLQTQAALFTNGYQRDWFGFNKGALIASFDGVKWFAVGQGRRVTATSTKLFLAMNSPFADLASKNDISVSVFEDIGGNTATNSDYEPSLSPDHFLQNRGATCQRYHQCNVDSDCVSQLGWEYVCADVTNYKTTTPLFDMNGEEKANQELSNQTGPDLLQGLFPSGGTKRCIYRGAGAPCKKDYSSNIVTNTNDAKKLLTCAPNFYCAGLGETAFNREIIREPNNLSVYLFGQEADYLGRPANYVGASSSLPSSVRDAISHNMSLSVTNTSDIGLCRPGKLLSSTDHITQHSSRDPSGRTDYISQVGSCDSTATNINRVSACPVFEDEDEAASGIPKGDYLLTTTATDNQKRVEQNMCGRESLDGSNESPFRFIEMDVLSSVFSLETQAIVKDACLRRPGSICHTDLDCGPNKLHAEQAELFGLDHFGGTRAEQQYWSEFLVCGQAQPEPTTDDPDFHKYDMTKNRCCREIGREITMYTQGPESIIPEIGSDNATLDTSIAPTQVAGGNSPGTPGRYSRYNVVNFSNGVAGTAAADPYHQTPVVSDTAIPKEYQWKTINDTGGKTCCGGGLIRKFADGTHNWANRKRLKFGSITNFNCINYMSDYHETQATEMPKNNYISQTDKLCLAPAEKGCHQPVPFKAEGITEVPNFEYPGFEVEQFELRNPVNFNNLPTALTHWAMDTTPLEDPGETGTLVQQRSLFAPYMPAPFENLLPINASEGPFNFMSSPLLHPYASFYVPVFLGLDIRQTVDISNITEVRIKYIKDGAIVRDVAATAYFDGTHSAGHCPGTSGPEGQGLPLWNFPGQGAPGTAVPLESWCISEDNNTAAQAKQVFHIAADSDLNGNGNHADDWDYAGVVIKYIPPGSPNRVKGDGTTVGTANQAMMPGNALYYLTKLARLELIGIPQITYEPLYCNTDKSKLVEGIFKSNITNRTQFDANSIEHNTFVGGLVGINGRPLSQIYDESNSTTDNANPDARVVFQDKLEHSPIFSDHEFQCCMNLGTETNSADKCCTGFAKTAEDGTRTCALPAGASLNVYFNRFVSTDGTGTEQPGGGLVDTDFIPETGEPKLNQEVNNKLIALGKAYCENGTVRQGAAFGYYFPQPNNGAFQGKLEDSTVFSIIDSLDDNDTVNDVGATRFLDGFRWNHHFYCADP
jgi:hypothetical protein